MYDSGKMRGILSQELSSFVWILPLVVLHLFLAASLFFLKRSGSVEEKLTGNNND
jgi:hypothetical protein